ncbi:MAG: hypothetical protein JJ974_01815 [Phycisphaerales bacterium]|nr:hypothetical protein [Phycisphaerales bacterium]
MKNPSKILFTAISLLAMLIVVSCSTSSNEEKQESQESVDWMMNPVWAFMSVEVPKPEDLDGAKGFGLVITNSDFDDPGDGFSWDEPNHPNAIGIGFDVHNPPPTDIEPDENGRVMGWFDEFGNWYDRPQREVSIHVDGQERINVLSPVEFRTGEQVDIAVQLNYVTGGAHILVLINGQVVIDDMLWGIRAGLCSLTSGTIGDSIKIKTMRIMDHELKQVDYQEPVRVPVFEEELLTNAAWLKSEVDFSEIPEQVGRVIATLTLSEPEMGYDHWDKKGTIGLRMPSTIDDEGKEIKGERFEVFRFITPYRRGWTWHMDVTDLLPLFKDAREFDAHIGTYMKGWLVSFDLDFYPGELDRTPVKVVNLWNGNADIGDPEKPVEEFYVPREIEVPDGTTHARVRATVTGHGMFPNSKNAGEFMPIWRTMTISSGSNGGDVLGQDFISMSERNHLWKTDVYLNPCRPQGGTWKFDRSGWAPGDKVEPWIVDVQPEFLFGEQITVEYELDEYLNEGRGETWAPHHWTDAVVVFYK